MITIKQDHLNAYNKLMKYGALQSESRLSYVEVELSSLFISF